MPPQPGLPGDSGSTLKDKRLLSDCMTVRRLRDDTAEREPSDTLIRHRDILKSRSLLEQGLTMAKILLVMLVLFAKFRIVGWLESRRARSPHE